LWTKYFIWSLSITDFINSNAGAKVIARSGIIIAPEILEKFSKPQPISYDTRDGATAHG
jgi:hypothetical protein